MTQKAVIYGTTWCPHCNHAKAAFGERATFVDCEQDMDACKKQNVTAMPHIVGPNGKSVVGWNNNDTARTMETLGMAASHKPTQSPFRFS